MDYKTQILNYPDFGKVPPQANDMEEAVLGAILIDPDAIFTVIDILKPGSFYKEAHQKIYKSVIDLSKQNFPIDLLTVTEQLRKSSELDMVGGPIYITQLLSKIASSSNIEYHARIIAQKYIQREMIRFSTELQSMSFDDSNDISDLIGFAESQLLDIVGITDKKEASKLINIVDTVIELIQKVQNHEIKLIGTPSGFTTIDRKTGGFKNGELTIIAGRPSMGKTAVALQIALNEAELNYPVAFFSLEMSKEQLAQRCISNVSGKTNVQLMEGHCNLDDVCQKTERFMSYNLFIDDSAGVSIYELHAKAKRLLLKYGIKIIVVDYLQLVHGDGQNREQQVSSVSRGLKVIAKDLNIPVIALSQLNRELEKTGNKKPQLSNLRESGAIEQDADVVWFIHRPAKYEQQTISINGKERSSEGIAEISIAKNRNGICGSFYLEHNISLTEFKDIEGCTF